MDITLFSLEMGESLKLRVFVAAQSRNMNMKNAV